MPLDYLTRYEIWLVAGFVLIAADMLFSLQFFALSFGAGALLLGVAIGVLGKMGTTLGWETTLALFAIVSMAVLIPLRKWLNQQRADGAKDINDY